jgi:probable FeS assembly SUF system protein SufT
MDSSGPIALRRNVEAAIVPAGTRVTLLAGQPAQLTQALGGSYTVIVNGNMFRIDGRDADALGFEPQTAPAPAPATPRSRDDLERLVWDTLMTCFDPEIPVNIVDLGLVYSCRVEPLPDSPAFRVHVQMTLTAPGCGMGPVLQQDVQNKILALDDVADVTVDLVWDPPWNQAMMAESARLELGLY